MDIGLGRVGNLNQIYLLGLPTKAFLLCERMSRLK